MRLMAANWKMNPQIVAEAEKLAARVQANLTPALSSQRRGSKAVEVAICPPFPFLEEVSERLKSIKLGAQNVSAEAKGPHTGEVSAVQLKNLGVRYVIIGHSERRAMGESDAIINKKIKLALENGLEPILCVGYGTTKSMRDEAVKRIISKQLTAALKATKGKITIAYEPVWAISRGPGTAVSVAPEHAANIIKFIKSQVRGARVLYGGSVTSKNAAELARLKIIDGGLVGGASLDPAEFISIINKFSS